MTWQHLDRQIQIFQQLLTVLTLKKVLRTNNDIIYARSTIKHRAGMLEDNKSIGW
jgi:hypothetical protein